MGTTNYDDVAASSVDATTLKKGGTAITPTATQLNQIGSAFGTVNFDRGVKVAKKSLTGAGLHAGVLNWQNPEASSILVLREVLNVTTVATAACTVDSGVTATSATTASDTLIDGLDVNSAIGVFDSNNDTDNGTNGVAKPQLLAAGKWVTFKEASGNATGLVADAYIYYVVV
jgi:hypothetical protein